MAETKLLPQDSQFLAPTGSILQYAAKAAPAGWLIANGAAVSRSTYSALFAITSPTIGTCTISNGANALVTLNSHGFVTGDRVYFTTTGGLPAGLSVNTIYYVNAHDANGFHLSTTFALANAGTTITTSSAGSGTHTAVFNPYGLGDGSTTFNLPDFEGRVAVGYHADDAEFDTLGAAGGVGEKAHVLLEAELATHSHNVATSPAPATDGGYIQYGSASIVAGRLSGTAGTNTAHNNIQPYTVVNYIIKT